MQLKIYDLGLIDYKSAWQFQQETFNCLKSGWISPALIFCRHYPVITLGRQAKKENILLAEDELRQKGISLYEIERGGDVTYHGPGQLTIYPILNLNYLKKDIHWYLRKLEEVVVDFCADLGICAQRKIGLTGVWVDEKKIASIGIAIRNWITLHGLSINLLSADLANFKFIRPCGMDIEMTALDEVLGRDSKIEDIQESLTQKFKNTLSGKEEDYDKSSLAGIKRGD